MTDTLPGVSVWLFKRKWNCVYRLMSAWFTLRSASSLVGAEEMNRSVNVLQTGKNYTLQTQWQHVYWVHQCPLNVLECGLLVIFTLFQVDRESKLGIKVSCVCLFD